MSGSDSFPTVPLFSLMNLKKILIQSSKENLKKAHKVNQKQQYLPKYLSKIKS